MREIAQLNQDLLDLDQSLRTAHFNIGWLTGQLADTEERLVKIEKLIEKKESELLLRLAHLEKRFKALDEASVLAFPTKPPRGS